VSWQKSLAQGFSTASELLQFLNLPAALGDNQAEQHFKTRVPREFAQRMERGNPHDPLLLQVLAQPLELNQDASYTNDPLHEKQANPIPGLIHKYATRVLITFTGTCAIHCRYCFRQHFPYQENNPGRQGWDKIMTYLQQDASIHEVILSGGDPMLATDSSFNVFLTQLEAIPHITTLRLHSRVPIVLPERLTKPWLVRLQASRLHKVMVLHTNHPNELTPTVATGCFALKEASFHLLNQSVLLKQINDNASTLAELGQKLFEFGVLPYYLHLLDKVQGAAHFDMPLETALELYRDLQRKLPGYLVPKLAKEEFGKANKTLFV
jgi:EF-P beta-lysylation protein EpmB